MKYIVENWFVIVGLIAVCAAGGYAVYVFVKMPSDKQLNKVREWLLYAVTKAEKELGGGTGQIKLRYVYRTVHMACESDFVRGFFDDGRRGT